MAAKTRLAIKTLVRMHTGRTKETLEDSECNDALKVALLEHPFHDAQAEASDYAITEAATYVTASPSTSIANIISARIIEVSGTRNAPLPLKTRVWWDDHVVNNDDNMAGWPAYGLKWGNKVMLDRPCESGLAVRLRVAYEQIFTSDGATGADSCVCPIYVLDKFVEHYVTAQVFKSLRSWDSYAAWMNSACGKRWIDEGVPGGELLKAIQADSQNDTALEIKMEGSSAAPSGGIAVENAITGHDDYGSVRWWT